MIKFLLYFTEFLCYEWTIDGQHPCSAATSDYTYISGLILGLRPANEKRRYKVTPSLIGWAQT